jgi:hypothetical protein
VEDSAYHFLVESANRNYKNDLRMNDDVVSHQLYPLKMEEEIVEENAVDEEVENSKGKR